MPMWPCSKRHTEVAPAPEERSEPPSQRKQNAAVRGLFEAPKSSKPEAVKSKSIFSSINKRRSREAGFRAQIRAMQHAMDDLHHELKTLRKSEGEESTVSQAVAEAKVAADLAAKEASKGDDEQGGRRASSWSIAMWLSSLPSISDVIAEAMLAPLHAEGLGTTDEPNEVAELCFVRALGLQDAEQGSQAVLRLLRDSPLLSKMASTLWQSAADLATARAATVHEMCGKFRDEAAFTLAYGGLDTFFGGLERLLGPPSAQLKEAMRREHCLSADSHSHFYSPNYGVNTTSEIEWHFVDDPDAPQILTKLGLTAWPHEEKLQQASDEFHERQRAARMAISDEWGSSESVSSVRSEDGKEASGAPEAAPGRASPDSIGGNSGGEAVGGEGGGGEEDPAQRMREPLSIAAFEAQWANIDLKLDEMDVDPIKEVEIVGARLYTGTRAPRMAGCWAPHACVEVALPSAPSSSS